MQNARIHRTFPDVNKGVTAATRSDEVERAWPLVVRVAVVASLLAACLGAGLYRFAGVGATPILIGVGVVGLTLGLVLPPARPAWLRRNLPL